MEERFEDYDMGILALNGQAYVDKVPETYDDIKIEMTRKNGIK